MKLPRIFMLIAMAMSSLAHADSKDEVFAAWEAMFAAKSYRATIETTVDNRVFQQSIDVVLPGRMRMRGGPGGDMVVTPEGAWMKIPGEDWSEAPPSTAALGQQFLSRDFIDQAKAGVRLVEALGIEDVKGKPAKVYRVDQSMTIVGTEVLSSTRLFVDVESGRPVRQEIESTAMDRKSRTVQELEYLPGLTIEAPK